MSALSTRIFLFKSHFLHIIPTLCVSDNTLIKVIHKHNIRTAFLPLPARGFPQLFWTFSISDPAFLQILQMVHQDIHMYMTDLQQWFLLCFLVTCLDNIFYTLHKHKLKKTHTKIYTNTLNIHKSNMYIYIHKHTQYIQATLHSSPCLDPLNATEITTCSSGHCIWDWYFSLMSSAIK